MDIFYLRGDRGQIVIISLIAAIVSLIILIVCACLCSQYVAWGGTNTGRGARREGAASDWEQILPTSAGLGQVEFGMLCSLLRVLGGAWGIASGLETMCNPIQGFCKVKAKGGGGASPRCVVLLFNYYTPIPCPQPLSEAA